MKDLFNRRRFFKLGAISIASIPLFRMAKVWASGLSANSCPTSIPESIAKKVIATDNKNAIRLGYVENSLSLVGNTEYKHHKKFKAAPEGSACGNCKFYKTKVKDGVITGETEGYAKCSMLANKYVSRCGWCKSYKEDKKKIALYTNLPKKS